LTSTSTSISSPNQQDNSQADVNLASSSSNSTAANARTFRFVGPRSRRAKKTTRKTPLHPLAQQPKSPIPLDAQDSEPQNPEPTHVDADLAHDAGFTTPVNIDSFLDTYQSEVYAENDSGDLSIRNLPLPFPSPGQLWTSLEIEPCSVPDGDCRLPLSTDSGSVSVHASASASATTAGHPGQIILSPSNLTFDLDDSLSFRWPNMESDGAPTATMLDASPSNFSLSTYISWAQQQEILLKYCA
jgi:hypothetical protein